MTSTETYSTWQCDQIATEHVSPKDLQRERDLMRSCWWEYRGEHPTLRTMLFASLYARMTRHYHEKDVDYTSAEWKTGLRGVAADADGSMRKLIPSLLDDEKVLRRKKTNLTSLWRARQAADEDGISYRVYLGAVFELNSRSMTRHTYAPRPNNLYTAKARMAALDAQCKEIEAYIPDFTNPNLMVGSSAPFKAEFDEWLFELGSLKKINKQMAFNRMAKLGLITQETADAWVNRVAEVI